MRGREVDRHVLVESRLPVVPPAVGDRPGDKVVHPQAMEPCVPPGRFLLCWAKGKPSKDDQVCVC